MKKILLILSLFPLLCFSQNDTISLQREAIKITPDSSIIISVLTVSDNKYIYVANIPDTSTAIPAGDTTTVNARFSLEYENSASDWIKTDSSIIYDGDRAIFADFDGHADVEIISVVGVDLDVTFHLYVNGSPAVGPGGNAKAYNTTRTYSTQSRYTGYSIGAAIDLEKGDELQVKASHGDATDKTIEIKAFQLRITEIF